LIPDGPYLDMHTHILPGIDDGSVSMEQTRNMLRQAYEEGIRYIIATPHYGIRNPGLSMDYAEEILEEVQKEADRITPGMRLLLGCELFYTDGIVQSLKRDEARTMAGTSYALVEFSTRDPYSRILKCVNEFTWNGYIPLIAHAERYRCLEGNLENVYELAELGAVIQINCRSFTGGRSKTGSENNMRRTGIFHRQTRQMDAAFYLEQKTEWAMQMLDAGLVHLIGSDCHDDGMRRPVYREALQAMYQRCVEETMYHITRENVMHFLRNEPIVW